MINWKKEKGFSLVEVMILFAVFAALIAASIPMMTRSSKSVPVKIARGAYVCYRDAQGVLHEARFNRKQQIGDDRVDKCTFKPIAQASAYQITLIGAGAGGYNNATVDTVSDEGKETFFKLKGGYSGAYASGGNVTWPGATSDGKGMITDAKLWEYFSGQKITLSALAPEGGRGQNLTGCMIRYDDCKCCKNGTETPVTGEHYGDYDKWYPKRPLPPLSDIYSSFKEHKQPNGTSDGMYYHYGNKGNNFPVESNNISADKFTLRVPTGKDDSGQKTYNDIVIFKNTYSLEDRYDQMAAFCENKSEHFGYGQEYRCTCKNRTYYGFLGGKKQYLTISYTIGYNGDEKDYYYNTYINGKTGNVYQNLLMAIGNNFEAGRCRAKTGGNDCIFEDKAPEEAASISDADIQVLLDKIASEKSDDDGKIAYCYKEVRPNGTEVTRCKGKTGNDVLNNTAIKYPCHYNNTKPYDTDDTNKDLLARLTDPNHSYTTCSNGVRIASTMKPARGALGASITRRAYKGKRNNNVWSGYNEDDNVRTANKYEAETNDNSIMSDYQKKEYLPALKISTNMMKRVYEAGNYGGSGDEKTITRTKIAGPCDITVGMPGKAHKGTDTREYKDFVEFGNGKTAISCPADGFSDFASAGAPANTNMSASYLYNSSDNRKEYTVTPLAATTKSQAVQYLQRHGLSPNLNFGQGGTGTIIKDRCLKLGGTFKVERYNEKKPNDEHELLRDESMPSDFCYDSYNTYKTVGAKADKNGAVTSDWLDIIPAQDGQSGAVIITW